MFSFYFQLQLFAVIFRTWSTNTHWRCVWRHTSYTGPRSTSKTDTGSFPPVWQSLPWSHGRNTGPRSCPGRSLLPPPWFHCRHVHGSPGRPSVGWRDRSGVTLQRTAAGSVPGVGRVLARRVSGFSHRCCPWHALRSGSEPADCPPPPWARESSSSRSAQSRSLTARGTCTPSARSSLPSATQGENVICFNATWTVFFLLKIHFVSFKSSHPGNFYKSL